jgi:hypothetical protein
MPVRYICKKCGFVLYEGPDKSGYIPSPGFVARMYGDRCPRCGAELYGIPADTKIQRVKNPVKKKREEKKIIVDKRDKKMVTVSIRIPAWMEREVVYLVEKHKYRSKSAFIRAALLQYIKKLHEEEEKQ